MNGKQFHNLIWCFVVFSFSIGPMLFAQEGEKPEEKVDVRMSLMYSIENNEYPKLISEIKTRTDRVYVGVSSVNVNFYYGEISANGLLGIAVTDDNGKSTFELSQDFYHSLDTTNQFLFYAVIEDDPIANDNDTDLEIIRAVADLRLEEIDSVKTAFFTINARDENNQLRPVEEVEVNIYVKRLFGMLPVLEYEETDEDGSIIAEIPNDIPGDHNGNIEIYAKVDDHSEYGTLILTQIINWGIPSKLIASTQPRELWSPGNNAPLYLVFIVNFIVIIIWGVIFYLFYLVFRINKLGTT